MSAFRKATLLKLFSADNNVEPKPPSHKHPARKINSSTTTSSSATSREQTSVKADNQVVTRKKRAKNKNGKTNDLNNDQATNKSVAKENLPQKVVNVKQGNSENGTKASALSVAETSLQKKRKKTRKNYKKSGSATNEREAVGPSSGSINSSGEKAKADIPDSNGHSQAEKPKKKTRKRKRKSSTTAGGDFEALTKQGEDNSITNPAPSPKQQKIELKYSKKEVKDKQTDVGKKNSKRKGKDKNAERKERLEGARFRFLNEMLYTSHSKEAADAFKSDPSSFEVYHQGYRRQIEKWPVKPIDLAIKYVKSRPKSDVIADLGCGEAKLATAVPQKVHSFDLKALNDRVTIADMSKLPLVEGSVNVVVYCLSLMGTNLIDFLNEAHRVLVDGGIVWIAEVSSRFNGDITTFADSLEVIGFKCTGCDTSLSHFVTLTFKKTKRVAVASKKSKAGRADITLAPCLYKKR